MHKDYFQSIPKPKELIKNAYESFLKPIQQQFDRLKENYTVQNCLLFEKLLQYQKNCKALKEEHKKPIFQYFMEKQLECRSFLHSRSTVALRILALTKVRLANIQLKWKQVYKMLIKEQSQITLLKTISLQNWLKILRNYYDPQNAIQVIKQLIIGDQVQNQNTYLYVLLFINISPKTSQQTFNYFLKWVIQSYYKKYIKPGLLLVFFIHAFGKRKIANIDNSYYQLFNNILFTAMTNTSKQNNSDSRFARDNAIIIYYLIGKSNPYSLDLLNRVFMVIKNNIHPFQNSTKALRFLYTIIRWLWKRVQNQKNIKKKLLKLQNKQQKKLQKQIKILQNQQTKQQQNQQQQQKQQQQQQQQSVDQDQQKQQADQLNLAKQLLIQQQQIYCNDQEIRKQKYQRAIKNQITQQILKCIQKHIYEMFQDIYFVNSKKTIPQILRYFYMFFPDLCWKSLELMDKATNIPHINDEALILNIKVTTQYMYRTGLEKIAIKNTLRLLDKIAEVRKIIDVWPIYSVMCSKIPLLDEQDMKLISQQDKQQFYKRFQLDHDKFYQEYSQKFMEGFKRLLRQGQYFDENTRQNNVGSLYWVIWNSYPYYQKRLLDEVIQMLVQNTNLFIFTFFASYDGQLSPNQRQILLNQLKGIQNSQLQDNLQIKQNILMALSNSLSLNQLSSYVRALAKKNRFSPLSVYISNKITYDIYFNPIKSTLSYFDTDPKLIPLKNRTKQQIQQSLKQINQYLINLLDQLYNIVEDVQIKETNILIIIKNIYYNKQNLKNIQKRKIIYQLLTLIGKILENIQHMLINNQNYIPILYNNIFTITNIFQTKFLDIIKRIVYNSQLIQDPKITTMLSDIICSEILKYSERIKTSKQYENRANNQNQHRQLPQNINSKYFIIGYIAKLRVCQSSIMLNSISYSKQIDIIKQWLLLLLFAPNNDKIHQIITIFFMNRKLQFLRDWFIQLYRLSIQINNKFYQIKLFQIFQHLKNYGIQFTKNQLAILIQLHTQPQLIMSQDIKIRQSGLKSLKIVAKMIQQLNQLSQDISIQMNKFLKKDKLQVLWLFYFYLLFNKKKNKKQNIKFIQIKSKKQQNQQIKQNIQNIQQSDKNQKNIKKIQNYLPDLQRLILSQTRLIRRIALFLYSAYHRKMKKKYCIKYQKQVNQQYKSKTLEQFLQTGYIYPSHSQLKIKDKNSKRKDGPYSKYIIKQSFKFPRQSYQFLIENAQNSQKFLTYFHLDMASTVQQLVSAMTTQKQADLNDIIFKMMEQNYTFLKLNKFQNSRIQLVFGYRFFKYLFIQDAQYGYQFFQRTKQYVKKTLLNLESLDNQALLLIYCSDLLQAYQRNYHKHGSLTCIQEYLSQIFAQLIERSSGAIFKKIVTLFFKKIQNIQSLKFIKQLCQNWIQKKYKISRCSQLLLVMNPNNRKQKLRLLKILLQGKYQLDNNYLNKLIQSLILFPDKIPIDINLVQNNGLLKVQQLIQNKQLYKLTQNIYIANKKQFQQFLILIINEFISSKTIQLLKVSYNILNSTLQNYSKSLHTQQNIYIIIQLIKIGFKLINNRQQIQIQYKNFQNSLKSIFNYPMQINYFQIIINNITNNLQINKKNCQILVSLVDRPSNFFKMSQNNFIKFVLKVLQFQQNSTVYKQLLYVLSILFSYRIVDLNKFQIKQKNQKILLLQGYILGTLQLNKQIIQKILNEATKERRNLWARQMLAARGKKQFLDNQQQYQIWRSIKAVSNPYHYHA